MRSALALSLATAVGSSFWACSDDKVPPLATAACSKTVQDKEALNSAQLASWSVADATEMTRTGGDQALEADYAGKYRDDLSNHPGCIKRPAYGANLSEPYSSDNEATVPTGTSTVSARYPCAAKLYSVDAEDTSKPIVILVHGNSSGVTSFEEYFKQSLAGQTGTNLASFQFTIDSAVREQLATKLLAAGHRVIGFDARVDLVRTLEDFDGTQATGNPFLNIDHGWAVPMLQSLIKAVMLDFPARKISIVGHSLGVTTTRDALRRLYLEHKAGVAGSVNPFAHLRDVILVSGANHGVSTGSLCGMAFSGNMKGTVTCEMGKRDAFIPTYFTKPLNGPDDLLSTPCADGDYAYMDHDACDGNVVQYTTLTMEDIEGGQLQDEFVSEASAKLDNEGCVDNELVTLSDYDTSGYFFTGLPGFLANHFGALRSDEGMAKILAKLGD
ncbi:MAG: hypothetical protein H6729_14465 [Deltaproteobacteria bacterium]|nr:hypothetical protein [Deltaproteobacteria bacterium]